jgi:sec-independent protein translocase protein TatC
MPRRRITRLGYGQTAELVDHLGELRSRLMASLAAFGVACGLCFWQNHQVLQIVNAPLHGRKLLTLGVAEPFTTTFTMSAYAAIVLTLPVLLYQLYAFIAPAVSKEQRKVAVPLLLMVPVLFIAGVSFGYFVVAPAALKFLLHFNSDEFHIQLRASEYYSFMAMTLASVGILFQVPVGVLALSKLGVVTPEMLRSKRRMAYLVCTIVAAALPGVDPVSMILETVPLIVLYEVSIWLAVAFGGTAHGREASPSASA